MPSVVSCIVSCCVVITLCECSVTWISRTYEVKWVNGRSYMTKNFINKLCRMLRNEGIFLFFVGHVVALESKSRAHVESVNVLCGA